MERPLVILGTASDERLVALASAGDERAGAAIVDIAADLGVAGAIRRLAHRARGTLKAAA
jgi:hypothetical protein